MRKLVTKACIMCQAKMTDVHYHTKYCADCRRVRTRQIQREFCQRHKERIAEREKANYQQHAEKYRARSREYQRRIRAEREAKLQAFLTELAQRKQTG
jgi:hypothetical protein